MKGEKKKTLTQTIPVPFTLNPELSTYTTSSLIILRNGQTYIIINSYSLDRITNALIRPKSERFFSWFFPTSSTRHNRFVDIL